MNSDGTNADLDLTGIAQRLRQLNPELTNIIVEPPQESGAAIRVVIETTKEELDSIGGRLRLQDPEIPEDSRIETVLRFLDHEPGKQMKVELRRSKPDQ